MWNIWTKASNLNNFGENLKYKGDQNCSASVDAYDCLAYVLEFLRVCCFNVFNVSQNISQRLFNNFGVVIELLDIVLHNINIFSDKHSGWTNDVVCASV